MKRKRGGKKRKRKRNRERERERTEKKKVTKKNREERRLILEIQKCRIKCSVFLSKMKIQHCDDTTHHIVQICFH